MRITQLRTRTESFGKTCFHIHHHFYAFLGSSLIKPCQLIHLLYMCTKSIAYLGSSLIVLQIIFALAHAQAGLIRLYGIHAAVHFISAYVQDIVSHNSFLLHLAQQCINLFPVLQCTEAVNFCFNGSHTVFVQLHAVHYDFIQITNFLSYTAGFVLRGSQLLDESLNLLTVIFRKDGKRTIL